MSHLRPRTGAAIAAALEPGAEQTLEQGVLEGRTLFAATGDTGSSCPVLVLGPDAGAGNGVPNQGTPGWDYVSGWGTPVLGPLMTDVDGRTTPVR